MIERFRLSGLRVLYFCLVLAVCAASIQRAYASPCSGTGTVAITNGVGLQCVTATGTIEYDWVAPASGTRNSLGTINVSVGGSLMFSVSPAIYASQGNLAAQSATVSGGVIAITYLAGSTPLYVDITPAFDGNILSALVAQDTSKGASATVTSVAVGSWPVSLSGREIALPYYTQTIHYFDSIGLFANTYWDLFNSHATTLISASSPEYLPKTDGTVNPLYERLALVVSPHIGETFPILHNPPSPYMQQLSGNLVLDIATGTFAQMASALANLNDHGINNCSTIIHDWQGMGRDNGLPQHYPASTSLGGNAELLAANTASHCFASVQETYSDYYPDYPLFNSKSVALNGDGSEVYGWLNLTANKQAYVTKPTWYVTNAQTQSPLIHANLGTTADYLDVNSAAPPWSHTVSTLNSEGNEYQGVDADAAVAGAGMFSSYISASAQLWAYERSTHGGPVFGEGKDHWIYSGLLDGVEAQVGPAEGNGTLPGFLGSQTPLFVDFDLSVIHPLQVNHGMGIYQRWAGPQDSLYNTSSADAYRMQEVIFGHAPSISQPDGNEWLWSVIPRALQEQFLVTPVAARYGTQAVSQVQYQVDGSWIGSSAAAAANDFSRAQVTYANGDTIVANSQEGVLSFDGWNIPQFGWLAEGNGLLAYTALIDGVVADYAQTSTSYFANARNAADLATEGCAMGTCLTAPGVGPTVAALGQLQSLAYNPTAKQLSAQWTVFQNFDPTKTYSNFFQVEDSSGNVIALPAAIVSSPASPWLEGQVQTATMSVTVPAGTYTVHGGICDTGKSGESSTGASTGCVPLYGTQDTVENHYLEGTLTVSGNSAGFSAQPAPAVAPDARLNMTGAVLDFGPIRTDGMVYLNQNPTTQVWTLRAWPRFPRPSTSQTATIQINNSAIGMPGALLCDSANSVTPTAVSGTDYWQVNLPAGAKACLFTASGGGGQSGSTATVSPASITFPGTTAIGAQSQQQVATLTNNGSAAIAIGNITLSGANPSSFSVANTCGSSLATGASCAITTTFQPTVGGSLQAAVMITDSAGNSPQSISLQGTAGAVPALGLSANSLPFDNQAVGISSSSKTVSLTNTGNAALTINGIALSGANASSFTLSNSCGASLAAGASCVVGATFNPTVIGSLNAAITINTNAATSPDSVALSGFGTAAPTLSVSAVSGQGSNPSTALLGRGTQFSASAQGTTATGFVWSLQGGGSLTSTGGYTAPNVMPGNPNVVVTATLSTDPTVTGTYQMTLINPVASIYGTSPTPLPAGQTTAVTLTGTSFVAGSTVMVNGAAVPTTYQSFTSLVAQVPVSASASAPLSVTVMNPSPGGGVSAAASLQVVQPSIVVGAVSGQGSNPTTALLGRGTQFSVLIHNSTSTAVTWSLQGAGVLTTSGGYTAPTAMPANPTVVVTATLVSQPTISASYTLTLINPVAAIYGFSPSPLWTGQTTTVTVTGNAFVAGSTVTVNGTAVPTTFQSFTSLTAQIPVAISATSPLTVAVSNPLPGGGVSASASLAVVPPNLLVSANSGQGFDPTTAVLGRGTQFSVIVHNSTATAVTWSLQGAGVLTSTGGYTAPTSMPANPTVVVTCTLVSQPSITTSYTLTLVNPVASINGVTPSPLPTGQTTAVTLSGTGFVTGSTVTVNGTAVSTTFQSPTSLVAQVPVGSTSTGTLAVAVSNPAPGGGVSAAASVAVVQPNIVLSAVSGQGFDPTTALLGRGTQFTALVHNSAATAVSWTLQGAGTLTGTGGYTAPNTLPSNATVVVTATLVSQPTVTASYTMTLINPVASIYGTTPSPLWTGQTTSVTLSGTAFVPGSTVMVNGAAVPTTYQSFTSLIAQIPVGTLSTAPLAVAVSNPAPGGGVSAAASVAVVPPNLVVSAVSGQGFDPATAVLGRGTQFSVLVHNSAATAVSWSLNGAGILSATGGYTAPAVMPANPTVVVTCTLVSQPAIATSYTLTLVSPAASMKAPMVSENVSSKS